MGLLQRVPWQAVSGTGGGSHLEEDARELRGLVGMVVPQEMAAPIERGLQGGRTPSIAREPLDVCPGCKLEAGVGVLRLYHRRGVPHLDRLRDRVSPEVVLAGRPGIVSAFDAPPGV